MPILFDERIHAIGQDGFHSIAHVLVGHAFDVQDEFGRVCDERIYQTEVALRCRADGFADVETEVPIHVTHGSYRKTVYMDLLIDYCAMFELKAADALHDEHWRQALNYLLLTGLRHGKLVNLKPPSVEHEFVSTTLTESARREFAIDEAHWVSRDEDDVWLRATIEELLDDWGAFVDTSFFIGAICHFRGGEPNVVRPVEIFGTEGRVLGTQHCRLLNPRAAFTITAMRKDTEAYRASLRKFLSHTKLATIHWINLNGHTIQLQSLPQ